MNKNEFRAEGIHMDCMWIVEGIHLDCMSPYYCMYVCMSILHMCTCSGDTKSAGFEIKA